jgi:hypothetical protein
MHAAGEDEIEEAEPDGAATERRKLDPRPTPDSHGHDADQQQREADRRQPVAVEAVARRMRWQRDSGAYGVTCASARRRLAPAIGESGSSMATR